MPQHAEKSGCGRTSSTPLLPSVSTASTSLSLLQSNQCPRVPSNHPSSPRRLVTPLPPPGLLVTGCRMVQVRTRQLSLKGPAPLLRLPYLRQSAAVHVAGATHHVLCRVLTLGRRLLAILSPRTNLQPCQSKGDWIRTALADERPSDVRSKYKPLQQMRLCMHIRRQASRYSAVLAYQYAASTSRQGSPTIHRAVATKRDAHAPITPPPLPCTPIK